MSGEVCGARLEGCRCSLAPHDAMPGSTGEPHHCEHGVGGPCGGMWFDDPEPGWKWIVRFPVAPALAEGFDQPVEPIREFFPEHAPRQPIRFFPAPSLAGLVDATATEVRGELS